MLFSSNLPCHDEEEMNEKKTKRTKTLTTTKVQLEDLGARKSAHPPSFQELPKGIKTVLSLFSIAFVVVTLDAYACVSMSCPCLRL